MTNPLELIRRVDTPTLRDRIHPLKSRRQRRAEKRDREALMRLRSFSECLDM